MRWFEALGLEDAPGWWKKCLPGRNASTAHAQGHTHPQRICHHRRNHRHSGLCGQAPSDYLELAEFLVKIGIDSMSLNPDTLLGNTRHVLEVEKIMQN